MTSSRILLSAWLIFFVFTLYMSGESRRKLQADQATKLDNFCQLGYISGCKEYIADGEGCSFVAAKDYCDRLTEGYKRNE